MTKLHYAATFSVARIGARWYVKVTLPDESGGTKPPLWSAPLLSRAAAEQRRDELRESLIADAKAAGWGGSMVVHEPPKAAKDRS